MKIFRKLSVLTITCGVLTLAGCVEQPGGALGTFGSDNIRVITLTPETLPNAVTPPIPAKARKSPNTIADEKPVYKIGIGDILKISLYTFTSNGDIQRIYPSGDYDATNSAVVVKEDGKMSLPYIGEVVLVNRTQGEITKTIADGLKKYFKRSQVDVRVMEYNSKRVVVTGEVKKPGEQKLTMSELRVVGAIEAAEGLNPEADLANAEVRHSDGTSDPVDLMALYNKGDQSQNLVLHAGDTLFIPMNHANKVFVAGEVVKPMAMPIPRGRLTLAEALMEAGGLEKISASKSNVYVVRGGVGDAVIEPPSAGAQEKIDKEQAQLHATVYQLSMETPESYVLADQMMLRPRDVVYVSPRGITEWDRFISQLIPGSVQSLLYGAIFTD